MRLSTQSLFQQAVEGNILMQRLACAPGHLSRLLQPRHDDSLPQGTPRPFVVLAVRCGRAVGAEGHGSSV